MASHADFAAWQDPDSRQGRLAIQETSASHFLEHNVPGRWLALLDDEEVAQRGFAEMAWDLEWALQRIREAGRWQAAFA